VLDIALASVLLLLLSPLLLVIALVVAVDGRGRVIFSQERIGCAGRPFRIHKFHTLDVVDPVDGAVVATGDPRPTRVGAWLRHTRLDELPQLYDVLRGAMALVGPRPETALNLGSVDAQQRARWLCVRPGLTGPTQLAFIAEDDVLASVADPTKVYREILVPAKVRHGIDWLARRSMWADLAVLLRTPVVLASSRRREASRRFVRSLLEQP
jgi:lipopolysaccharide/colanic/teichoic acid biosynthesis glycosyltransferase